MCKTHLGPTCAEFSDGDDASGKCTTLPVCLNVSHGHRTASPRPLLYSDSSSSIVPNLSARSTLTAMAFGTHLLRGRQVLSLGFGGFAGADADDAAGKKS